MPKTARSLRDYCKAEDERRWDNDLHELFAHPNAAIRKRAALAAGRIGNEDSVSALAGLLKDADTDVRAMAAFAIGEVEAASGADPLLAILKSTNEPINVRARAIEALGKIAGALPREQEARRLELGAAILEALKHAKQSTIRSPDRDSRLNRSCSDRDQRMRVPLSPNS